MKARSRRLWTFSAAVGILLGCVLLIVGERTGHHGVRLGGALIAAAGLLCGVVRFAGRE